jgi:hypothetical protein
MNTQATYSAKNNARLMRIQKVSRLMRYCVLLNLVFNLGFWLIHFPPWKDDWNLHALWFVLAESLLIFWFWKLAQLFGFYQRGIIFSPETIRCIKMLGVVCLIGWSLNFTARLLFRPGPVAPEAPTHSQAVVVKKSVYHMGFLSFDFGTGVDFGLLLVGASVSLAAWIMDEGRKLKEDQELTV